MYNFRNLSIIEKSPLIRVECPDQINLGERVNTKYFFINLKNTTEICKIEFNNFNNIMI